MTNSYLIGFHLDAQGQAVEGSTAYREGLLTAKLTRTDKKGSIDRKNGKPCGKGYISKDQKCHTGISTATKVGLGGAVVVGGGLIGVATLGAAGLASANARNRAAGSPASEATKEAPRQGAKEKFADVHAQTSKVKAAVKEEVDFANHIHSNPEAKKTYQQATKKAFQQGGSQGRQTAHNELKKHWRENQGKSDPLAPKVESSDWHKTLGVSKNASPDEIKSAYRTLSKKHHPDVSKDPDAIKKFEKINQAYAASKARKDALGSRWRDVERAYRSAQKVYDQVDRTFWRL